MISTAVQTMEESEMKDEIARLEGGVEFLRTQLDKERKRCSEMAQQFGALDYKVTNYEKVLRIITLRYKLETFVKKLYPCGVDKWQMTIYGKPDELSICDAVSELILSQDDRFVNDVFVKMVRDRLQDRNIDGSVFVKFSRWLYSLFSDTACDVLSAFSPPLPPYTDVKWICDMLKCFDIDSNDPAVICVQILIQPLDLPKMK